MDVDSYLDAELGTNRFATAASIVTVFFLTHLKLGKVYLLEYLSMFSLLYFKSLSGAGHLGVSTGLVPERSLLAAGPLAHGPGSASVATREGFRRNRDFGPYGQIITRGWGNLRDCVEIIHPVTANLP